jgi:hypothetical protein
MDWLFGSFATVGSLVPIIGIVIFFFFIKQKKGQEDTIPPLDLVDAKKLDDMVSKQVEDALKPILQSEGRNQEQIEQILTRTSLGGSSFRR